MAVSSAGAFQRNSEAAPKAIAYGSLGCKEHSTSRIIVKVCDSIIPSLLASPRFQSRRAVDLVHCNHWLCILGNCWANIQEGSGILLHDRLAVGESQTIGSKTCELNRNPKAQDSLDFAWKKLEDKFGISESV